MIKDLLKRAFGIESLLRYKASLNFISGVTKKKREIEVIITLTSIPKRFESLPVVLETLLSQTTKPDRIILWLSRTDRKGNTIINDIDELPWQIKKQMLRGLEIKFCEDWRSYRKLLPSMLLHPNALHVTADDDTLYPKDWLERLYNSHIENPDCIICYRGVRISYDEMGIKPYREWKEFTEANFQSLWLFPTGCDGILYPVNCFPDFAFDNSIFLHICETADDVWFKAMSILSNVKCVKIDSHHEDFQSISNNNDCESTLHYINNICGRNDLQIAAVFERFKINESNFS